MMPRKTSQSRKRRASEAAITNAPREAPPREAPPHAAAHEVNDDEVRHRIRQMPRQEDCEEYT